MTTTPTIGQRIMGAFGIGSKDGTKTHDPDYDNRSLACRINELASESDDYIRAKVDGRRSLLDLWTLCGRRYIGDHLERAAETEGFRNVTINRDQNAILSSVSAQTQASPRVKLEPEETQDIKFYCIRHEPAAMLGVLVEHGVLDLGDLTREELSGDDYLTETQYYILLKMEDPTRPGSKLLSAADFWVINDKLRSQVVQHFFDQVWRDAWGESKLVENEFYSNVFGHAPIVFSWDDGEQTFRIDNPPPTGVKIDPNHSNIDDAEYIIYDRVISLSKAKAMANDKAVEEQLNKAAASGQIAEHLSGWRRYGAGATYGPKEGGQDGYYDAAGSYHNVVSGIYDNINYHRKMVLLRTAWLHELMPMPPEDAEREGLIIEMPYSAADAVDDGVVELRTSDEVQTDQDGFPVSVAPVQRMYLAGTGEETSEAHPNWPQPRHVYVDDDGEPTHHTAKQGDERWPQRWGWRQVVTLPQIEHVIEDVRCPYSRPPVGWNRNIPIPMSIYGLGEPTRTEDITWFINRLASIIVSHIEFNRFPEQVVPRPLYEYWRKNKMAPHALPNKLTVLEVDEYREFISAGGSYAVKPPQLDPMIVELMDRWLGEHDRMSGRVDVLQGVPPDSGTSGRAIYALQQQALGPVGFKARYTEKMLERVAMTMTECMFNFGWLKLRTMRNRTTRWPVGVLRAVRNGAKEMRFTIEPVVVAGRGVTREREHEKAYAQWKDGAIGHLEMLRRTDDPDPEGTMEEMWDEQVDQAKRQSEAQQEIAAATQPAQQPGAIPNQPLPSMPHPSGERTTAVGDIAAAQNGAPPPDQFAAAG